MTKNPHTSPKHEQFFADVKQVMDRHKDVSSGFVLAHIKDRALLNEAPAAEDDCLAWAVDPQTGEQYCIKRKGQ